VTQRHDIAFPFRLAPGSGRAAEADYAAHVAQMIRQVLLTTPGERVNRPDFGCGLRRALFAPNSPALQATTELLVRQSLDKWLAGHVTVRKVSVSGEAEAERGELIVTIEYTLIDDGTTRQTVVRVV
jgi:phage baseplate assembly protein W